MAKTKKEGFIHRDLDPNFDKEITRIIEEPGKVYDGEDTDYNKGDFIENVFTFIISKNMPNKKIIEGIINDHIMKLYCKRPHWREIFIARSV